MYSITSMSMPSGLPEPSSWDQPVCTQEVPTVSWVPSRSAHFSCSAVRSPPLSSVVEMLSVSVDSSVAVSLSLLPQPKRETVMAREQLRQASRFQVYFFIPSSSSK